MLLFYTRLSLEEIPESRSHGVITKMDKIILESNDCVNVMFLFALYPLYTNKGI